MSDNQVKSFEPLTLREVIELMEAESLLAHANPIPASTRMIIKALWAVERRLVALEPKPTRAPQDFIREQQESDFSDGNPS